MADTPEAAPARHGASRSTVIGIIVAAVVLIAGATALVYARGGSPSPGSARAASGGGTTTTLPAASIAIQPPDGSTNVTLDSVVTVTAQTGRLEAVSVVGTSGTPLPGSMSADGTSWHSSGQLAFETPYTVTVSTSMPKGRSTTQVSHFTSLVPAATLGYTITPSSGLTVGVGEPVVLRFNRPVLAANQAALLNDLQVTESAPVATGWRWFDDEELHLRPQSYWPTGEQVTVTANLYGFDAGNNIWATRNGTTSFTVGDSHISTANVQTHEMTVTDNGKVVATYPISAGRSIYPTMNGIHIDLYRSQVVHMVSSTVGIPVNSPNGYDEYVYWDVNISDGGEYVHAAPWSVGAQGNTNVSHGCINISPANAQAFFGFSHIGDVISVVGSPRPPNLGDHGTMDWNTDWSQWTPATVNGSGSTSTAVPTTAPTAATTAPPTPTTAAPTTTTPGGFTPTP